MPLSKRLIGYSKTAIQNATALGNLSDVSISSVADTQVLTYNSSSGKWKNAAAGGGGGGTIGGSITNTNIPIADGADSLTDFVPAFVETANIFVGVVPPSITTDADENTSFGFTALDAITTGDKLTALGYAAGTANTTAGNSVYLGAYAGASYAGEDGNNTFVGKGAGRYRTDGSQNVCIGTDADNIGGAGNVNVKIGFQCGYNNTGSNNVMIGGVAAQGPSATSLSSTVIIGKGAGYGMTAGDYTIAIGRNAGWFPEGSENIWVGHNAGYGSTTTRTANSNIGIGYYALDAVTTASHNVALGYNAGGALTSGTVNVTIGSYAGEDLTRAHENVFVGESAGRNTTTGGEQVAIGRNALAYNVTGNRNIAIGAGAGLGSSTESFSSCILMGLNAGSSIADGASQFIGIGGSVGQNYGGGTGIAIGDAALGGDSTNQDSSSAYNIAMGGETMRAIAGKASKNIVIGFGEAARAISGSSTSEGSENVGMGYAVFRNITTGSNNIALGYQGAYGLTSGSDNVIIGSQAGYTAPYIRKSVVIGNEAMSQGAATSQNNTIIGYQANYENLSNEGSNTIIGYQAGYTVGSATTSLGGRDNTLVGYKAGYNLEFGARNTMIGYKAGVAASDNGAGNASESHIAIGYTALGAAESILEGDQNVAIGNGTMGYLSGSSADNISILGGIGTQSIGAVGSYNIAIGSETLTSISGSVASQGNIALGKQTMNSMRRGDYNIAIGRFALGDLDNGSSAQIYNTAVGTYAGQNCTTGSNNVYLGAYAGPSGDTEESDKLYIANSSGTPLIFGDFSAGYVGIGTVGPDAKLDVLSTSEQLRLTYSDATKFTSFTQGANDLTISNLGSGDDIIVTPNDKFQIHAVGVNYANVAEDGYLYIQPTGTSAADGANIFNLTAGQDITIDAKADTVIKTDGGTVATFGTPAFSMGSSVTLIENATLGTISGTAFQYGTSEATYVYDVSNALVHAALVLTDANYYVIAPRPIENVGTPPTISTVLPDGSTEVGIKVTISQLTSADPQAALSVTAQGGDVIYEGASNAASAAVAIPAFRGANKTFLTIAAGVWIVID